MAQQRGTSGSIDINANSKLNFNKNIIIHQNRANSTHPMESHKSMDDKKTRRQEEGIEGGKHSLNLTDNEKKFHKLTKEKSSQEGLVRIVETQHTADESDFGDTRNTKSNQSIFKDDQDCQNYPGCSSNDTCERFKSTRNNAVSESGCVSDEKVKFENNNKLMDNEVITNTFQKNIKTDSLCIATESRLSNVVYNDCCGERELADCCMSPNVWDLKDLGKHSVFQNPKTGECFLLFEDETNLVSPPSVVHICGSVSSEEGKFSFKDSVRIPLSTRTNCVRRDSDMSVDGHEFERSISSTGSQFTDSYEEPLESLHGKQFLQFKGHDFTTSHEFPLRWLQPACGEVKNANTLSCEVNRVFSKGDESEDNTAVKEIQTNDQNNNQEDLRGSLRMRGLKNFVAWLACAESDWETFGLSFHSMLEKWGLPIFIEDRDLAIGGPYYENLARDLEERCNGKIIVVLSKCFSKSDHCLFLTYFAKTLDPATVGNNIIPVVIDKDVEIPRVLQGLALINYNRAYRSGWLKEKLVMAISS